MSLRSLKLIIARSSVAGQARAGEPIGPRETGER